MKTHFKPLQNLRSVFLKQQQGMSVDGLPLDLVEDDEDQDSQQPPSPSSQSETYMVGSVIANIFGLQYYSGGINEREMVGLVREPLNRFDPNAIRVVNSRAIQVGHIEKKVASVLAPLIDYNLVRVEGIVPNTPKDSVHYKLPCHIHVFAKIEDFETVKSAFSRCGLCLISQNDHLFNTSEYVVVKEKKTSDVNEIFKLVDENASKNMVILGTMEPPKDFILPDLFLHQKEGLSWLYHRENFDELPPFWEETDGGGFVNVLTNYQTGRRREPLRGGIFADDMGLGKTLTLLSLIALDKCKISSNEVTGIEDDDDQSVVSIGKRSRTTTVSRRKKPKTDDERKTNEGKEYVRK
ncbi:hypothetical protein L6452_41527 [Arctium lappa]|uniref:Uncharacterized protein n=1 Tax=Arctium lappa TaxID=4217 RepID=A0ACB8XPZ7_ARCLA|nr:hypothetical protein L6452_41527 [Arctium lappa]